MTPERVGDHLTVKRIRALALVTLALLCLPLVGQIDDQQAELRKQFPQRLRWDNVEGAPFFLDGPQPTKSGRFYWVTLEGDDEVMIHLPARRVLRLVANDDEATVDDVIVSASNGSGVSIAYDLTKVEESNSFVLMRHWSSPMLLRLRRSGESKAKVRFAIMMSRRGTLPVVHPYRKLVAPEDGKSVGIKRWGDASNLKYWLSTPSSPLKVTVNGPTRLMLHTRFLPKETQPKIEVNYSLTVAFGEQTLPPISLYSSEETGRKTWLDDRPTMVGQRKTAFIDLPDGTHEVVVTPTVPLYLRVLDRIDSDYLFPGLNAPETQAKDLYDNNVLPKVRRDWRSRWPEADASVLKDVGEAERLASAILRTNRYRGGGARAFDVFDAAARMRPDLPEAESTARRFRYDATFYMELPPIETAPAPTHRAVVIPLELRELNEWHAQRTISREQINNRLNALPSVVFRSISPGQTMNFKLPVAPHAGELRMFAYTNDTSSKPSPLSISIGKTTREVIVRNGPEVPAHDYVVSSTLAALSLSARTDHVTTDEYPETGFNAFFGDPVRQAGSHELAVEEGVGNVSISSPDNAVQPVFVAVQLRMPKTFSLSDGDYAKITQSLRARYSLPGLITCLDAQLDRVAPVKDPDLEDWCNTWMPTLRRLRLNAEVFASLVDKSDADSGLATSTPLNKKELDAVIVAARKASEKGDYVSALGLWTRVSRGGGGQTQVEAFENKIECLFNLGEEFTANVLLRSLALFSEDASLRGMAVNVLTRRARAVDKMGSLFGLYCHRFFNDRDEKAVRDLFELFDYLGDSQAMLMVGSLMGWEQLPADRLVWAAADLGWWEQAMVIAQRLPEAERLKWAAKRVLNEGPPVAVRSSLKGAGQEVEEKIRLELNLRRRLQDPNQSVRAKAILEWEDWHQSRLRDGGRWASAHDAVVNSGGSAKVYSSDRDLAGVYWQLSPTQPLDVTVLGPCRIRVDLRLLHGGPKALDDWLTVATPGFRREVSVINSVPVPGLSVVGNVEAFPGKTTSVEIAIGPGVHTIRAKTRHHLGLVRVMRLEPRAISNGILPPFNMATIYAILYGTFGHEMAFNELHSKYHMKVAEYRTKGGVVLPPVSPIDPFSPKPPSRRFELVELSPELRVAIALRFGWPIPELSNDEGWKLVRRQDKRLALLRAQRYDDLEVMLTAQEKPWCRLWRNDPVGAMEALKKLGDAGVVDWMTLLLLRLESVADKKQRAALIHAAERRVHAVTKLYGVQRLRLKILDARVWERFDTVFSSAGVRKVEVTGWRPESESLQIRKSLMPPVADTCRVIGGGKTLRYAMINKKPRSLRVKLKSMIVPFIRRSDLPVTFGAGEKPVVELSLKPGQEVTYENLKMPVGNTEVTIGTGMFPSNHYLSVSIDESDAGNLAPGEKPMAFGTTERTYHLATADEPLIMKIKGPTMVRVDELVNGTTSTSIRSLDVDGWNSLKLLPGDGRKEGLYRVFVRQTQQEASEPEVPSEMPSRLVRSVPDHPFTLPLERRGDRLRAFDAFALGRQEDGTWTLQGRWVSRRQFDEGTAEDQERFWEFGATHRAYHPHLHVWLESSAFNRIHSQGGPTVGIEEYVHYSPPWSSFDYFWNGRAFLQFPNGDDDAPTGNTAWSLYWRGGTSHRREFGPKLVNTMKAEFFQYVLSEDDGDDFPPGYLDQDIFTEYKYDHRFGVRFSDTLTYRPWLDTAWKASAALGSNEDMTPDSFGIGLSWQQMFGDFQTDLGYRAKYYFEDDDRSSDKWRNAVQVEAQWERWFDGHSRLELGVQFRHDVEASANNTIVFLRWHFGNGRDYRDYRPGTPAFKKVRQHRIPFKTNNRMEWTDDD